MRITVSDLALYAGAYPCRCVSADRIGKMERHSGTEYIGEGKERKRGRLIPLGL